MNLVLGGLVPLTILFSWLRLFGIGSHQLDGTTLGTMPVPLLARVYMHVIPIVISVIAAIAAVVSGVLPWWVILVAIASGAILVALPVRYTLTDTGIKRTFSAFRRWTEFAGVERAPGGAWLKPLRKTRPAHIWLSGSRGDDEFLQLLRTLIRNAYQGRSDIPTFPGTPGPHEQESLVAPSKITVASFSRSRFS